LLVTLITAQPSLAEGRSLAKSVTTTITTAQPSLRRSRFSTQAREVLGWEPKVQLEAGLKKTIEYFAQSL